MNPAVLRPPPAFRVGLAETIIGPGIEIEVDGIGIELPMVGKDRDGTAAEDGAGTEGEAGAEGAGPAPARAPV